jgi:hypothetical protein
MIDLEYVKALCNDICWNGAVFIEVSPLSEISQMDCPTVLLSQNEDGQFGIDAGEKDENGYTILHTFEMYNWPDWAKNQELHITVGNE